MINPELYGVSFSVKQCRNFKLDPKDTLDWLIAQGWRRFRLMSYWNEHQKGPDAYDFTQLDWQIATIAKAGGIVTLCLGAKQPRWPEYHWPSWAWKLPELQRNQALLAYVETVVQRYQDQPAVVSWQLENEALLNNFGHRIDVNRPRLRHEFALIKQLDPTRPILMSTSNGWGIPIRRPLPDKVGFSLYLRRYEKGKYRSTVQSASLHRFRKFLIQTFLRRSVFIHELQCEPWGLKAIWEMSAAEQNKSMSIQQIQTNLQAAKRIGAYPIDLWGGEWWYWRHLQGDDTIWQTVSEAVG
jgi:hypothetical protein